MSMKFRDILTSTIAVYVDDANDILKVIEMKERNKDLGIQSWIIIGGVESWTVIFTIFN